MLDTNINQYSNQIIKTNTISNIIKLTEQLIELDYNVIMILDIDDTVLSSKIGQKFVEKDISKLVDMVYTINPLNLIFLTARDSQMALYTRKKLNSVGLLHKGKFIDYNIICSPYDNEGNPTKGQTLFNYFDKGFGKTIFDKEKNNWIIFIDDLEEQIDSVNKHINQICPNYTLFHYKYSLFNFNLMI
jgi:hypothetical protein